MDAVNLSGSMLCLRCQTGLNALLLDPLEPNVSVYELS